MRGKQRDPMLSYAFLFDRDASKAASLFPKKRTKTLAAIGLSERAADSKIVQEAWRRYLTIVTCNGDDFVKHFLEFLGQTKKTQCHEMFGLVVLPNGYELQKRALRDIETRLKFGRQKITWADVHNRNYYVRVKRSGGAEVRTFRRCSYCEKKQMKLKNQMK
jgi:hypothetical protein